jgi:hypothetical protein
MQNVIVIVNVTGVETVTVVVLVTLERATLEDAIVIVDHASGVACGIDHTMVLTIVTLVLKIASTCVTGACSGSRTTRDIDMRNVKLSILHQYNHK